MRSIVTRLNSDKKLTHYLRLNDLPMESYLSSQFHEPTQKRTNLVIGGSSFAEYLPSYELTYKKIYPDVDQILRTDIGLFDLPSEIDVIKSRALKNIIIFYHPLEFEVGSKVNLMGYQSSPVSLKKLSETIDEGMKDNSLIRRWFYGKILKSEFFSFIFRSTILDSLFYSLIKHQITSFTMFKSTFVDTSNSDSILIEDPYEKITTFNKATTFSSIESILYSLKVFTKLINELSKTYKVYLVELKTEDECMDSKYYKLRETINLNFENLEIDNFYFIKKNRLPQPEGVLYRDCTHLDLSAPLTLNKMHFLEKYFKKLSEYIPEMKVNFVYKKAE